jgi:hypothetical protein
MESIVVEREYDGPADLDAIERVAASIAWCYEQRSVAYAFSLVSPDLRRFVCLYHAPDAEAVRTVQRIGGFDYVRAWTAQVIGAMPEIDECIVVERVLDRPIAASDIDAGPTHLVSHLSRDGLRVTSVYSADPVAIALPVSVASERRWAAKRLVKP